MSQSTALRRRNQNMKTSKIIFLLVLLCGLLPQISEAGCTGSSPSWTCTPDYTSLNNLINNDNPGTVQNGDVINVGAGTESWPDQLLITKPINIVGSGAGTTIINGGYIGSGDRSGTSYYLVVFQPASPGTTGFSLSGFTFNLGWNSGWLMLRNSSSTYQTNVKIFDNAVNNADQSIHTYGHFYGVVYKNIITQENRPSLCISNYGNNATTWDNYSFVFGSANNMYYEDNIITMWDYNDHGLGGRSAFRYNTIYYTNSSAGAYPLFDAHGNMGSGGNYGSMGFELYGNKIVSTHNIGMRVIDQRGGKSLFFYNNITSSGAVSMQSREEVGDHYNPTDNAQPQHVSSTYYFRNLKNNTTETVASISQNVCADSVGESTPVCPTANDQYSVDLDDEVYNYNASYNGSGGIGCGTLGNRPPTCTAGTAYWATSQGCSDLSNLTGASSNVSGGDRNPSTYIIGTLYICGSNNWNDATEIVPYEYPHPLRGESTPTLTIPAGVVIGGGGNTISVSFDTEAQIGTGGSGGWVLSASGGAVTMTYASGTGTTTLVYSLSRTIYSGETATLAYTQPLGGDGIEAVTGGDDLDSFSGLSVTNSSTQTLSVAVPTGVSVTSGGGVASGMSIGGM